MLHFAVLQTTTNNMHYLKHTYVCIEMFRNLQYITYVYRLLQNWPDIKLYISNTFRVYFFFVNVYTWFLKLLKLCWLFII